MAIGDEALAAGYPLVPSTGDGAQVNLGAQEINRTRDFVAEVKNSVQSFPEMAAWTTESVSRATSTRDTDPELTLAILPSSSYLVIAQIVYSGPSGVNMNVTWGAPAGINGGYSLEGEKAGGTSYFNEQLWGDDITMLTDAHCFTVSGILHVGSTGGNFSLRWGSGTNGSNVTRGVNSAMFTKKVG
jgi:hypothetical protein